MLGEVAGLDASQLLLEGRLEFGVVCFVAGDETNLYQAGQIGVVLARGPDGVHHCPLGMADFQPQVPQQVEKLLDNAVGSRITLLCRQHKQVDVGKRRQLAAAVAADRDQGEPGLAMPCHNACEKRLEKLVYSQRVTPHIDGAVALEIEIGGEPVFQLTMGGLRRIEERGT